MESHTLLQKLDFITLSLSLSLSNTLLVSSLSNKLLYVAQATEEFSHMRSLGVVLREMGCTTWMILA